VGLQVTAGTSDVPRPARQGQALAIVFSVVDGSDTAEALLEAVCNWETSRGVRRKSGDDLQLRPPKTAQI
jgi:hypothetical protein